MDKVSMRHDREVPSPQFKCINGGADCRNEMRTANENFLKGYLKGIATGAIFKQPLKYAVIDFFGGLLGFIAFGIEVLVYDILYSTDRKRNSSETFWKEHMAAFGVEDNLRLKFLQNKLNNIENKSDDVLLKEVFDREIERLKEDYTNYIVSNACSSNPFCKDNWMLVWYGFVNNPIRF